MIILEYIGVFFGIIISLAFVLGMFWALKKSYEIEKDINSTDKKKRDSMKSMKQQNKEKDLLHIFRHKSIYENLEK